MGKQYEQLSSEERAIVADLYSKGRSLRQIAAALDRPASTVSRELKRNRGRKAGYRAAYAQQQARARRWRGSRLERDAELRLQVLRGLKKGWSPEQVCGWLERRSGRPIISPESIYRFIQAQITRHNDFSWRHYLPRAKFKRGWRGRKGGSPALHIQARVSIEERPAAVADRSIPGHWEADLMMFARYDQALLTLHERSSRLLIAMRPDGKHAGPIAAIIASLLEPLPPLLRQTITFDNGTEFARHYELHRLDIQTFFCDPHSPWQNGGIENAIGRMRRQIPRKTDLATLTTRQLSGLLRAYNNTPRKCLDWRSPAELFWQQVLHLECESTSPLSRG